jgi:hypothetical protein
MAIRVIEVPSSVRFDPPPRPCLEDRREPTISMKKPVGVLGMTDEERAELRRTKKWPSRQVEAPEGPPGLSPTGRRSLDAETDAAAPPLREALWHLVVWSQRSRPGAKGKIAGDIALVLKLLNETGGNVEQSRTRFIVDEGRARFIVEPLRLRPAVRSTRKNFKSQQTGKRVLNLTSEQRSVLSKRFTRAMKEIRKLNQTRKRFIDDEASNRVTQAIKEFSNSTNQHRS